MNLQKLQENLEKNGFTFRYFATKEEAADYLEHRFTGKTIAFGGSMTAQELNLYERMGKQNQVLWHWQGDSPVDATKAQVYVSSVNGIAETGELINIDGAGNRVAATLYGHEAVCLVAGINKVAETYEAALWRARNIAAPLNARRLQKKTPCALGEELKCYDCNSPERICRGLTVLWKPMKGVGDYEVVLVGETLGY